MKLIHAKSESNTIDCKDCEEKFTSESDLKIHQYEVSGNDEYHVWQLCRYNKAGPPGDAA